MSIRVSSYYITDKSHPIQDTFTNLGAGAFCFSSVSRKWYQYVNSTTKWIETNKMPSDAASGTSTAPTIQVGTTTTLPAGSQAKVIDTDPSANVMLNFEIPQGPAGPQGPQGEPGTSTGGGGTSVINSEIYVAPNGSDDTLNIKAAFAAAKSSGREITFAGNYFLGDKITLDKDYLRLSVNGKKATWNAKNNTFTHFIERVKPTDNAEALAGMYAAWYSIENIAFKGFQNQKGIAPGPCGGSEFNNLRFYDLETAIELRFALNARIDHPYFIGCINGAYIGCGDWTGADNANSQSNRTKVMDAECYMPTNGNVAIGVYNCSGVELRGTTIEGHKVVNGVEFIADSNVVKDFLLHDTHFECVQGASGAFFKGRIAGGTMKISKVFGQYAAYFMDVASTSGLGYVEVEDVPWWIGLGGSRNGEGKAFKTNNVSVHFDNCEAWGDFNTSLWDVAQQKCGTGRIGESFCGYNKYTFTKIPR